MKKVIKCQQAVAEGDGGIRTTHRHAVTAADLVPGHPAGGGHAPEVQKDAATENVPAVEMIREDGVVLQVLAVQVVAVEVEVGTNKDKTIVNADGHHGHAPHIGHRGVVLALTEAAAGRVTSIRLMTIDGVI